MFLKKTMLVGTALVFLPLAAMAELNTDNYAPEASTVKITSYKGWCAATIPPFKFTPAWDKDKQVPGHSHASQLEIKILCGHDPCEADIYMNLTCSGNPIAHATLTGVGTPNNKVTIDEHSIDPNYSVTAGDDGRGTAIVTIKKNGFPPPPPPKNTP